MNGRCETDPFDQAVDVCDSCYGEFCGNCLVEQRGRKHPVCKDCLIIVSGLRSGAKVVRRGEKKTAKARRKDLASTVDKGREFKFFDEDAGADPMLSPPTPLPTMEPAMPALFDGPGPPFDQQLPPGDTTAHPPQNGDAPAPPEPADDPVPVDLFDQPFDGTAFGTPFGTDGAAPAPPEPSPDLNGGGLERGPDSPPASTVDGLGAVGWDDGFDIGSERAAAAPPVGAEQPGVAAAHNRLGIGEPAGQEQPDDSKPGYTGGPSSAISQLSQLRGDEHGDEHGDDDASSDAGDKASPLDELNDQVPDLTRSPFDNPSKQEEPDDGPKPVRPRLHAGRPTTDSNENNADDRNARPGAPGGPSKAKPSGKRPGTGRSSAPGRSPGSPTGSPRRPGGQVRPPGHPGATKRGPARGRRGPTSNDQVAALAGTADDATGEDDREADRPSALEPPAGLKPKRRGVAAPGAPATGPDRVRSKPSEVPPALRGPSPDPSPDDD